MSSMNVDGLSILLNNVFINKMGTFINRRDYEKVQINGNLLIGLGRKEGVNIFSHCLVDILRYMNITKLVRVS